MRRMKDFSWQVFCKTGDIDAYLLYKDVSKLGAEEEQPEQQDEPAETREA